jgi:hypothetical protein
MDFLFLILLAAMSHVGYPNPGDCLAPHPIYFSVDGRPSTKKVEVDGKVYDVTWDGSKLDIKEEEQRPGVDFMGHGCLGCLPTLLFSGLSWAAIIALIMGHYRHALIFTMVGAMAVILIWKWINHGKNY